MAIEVFNRCEKKFLLTTDMYNKLSECILEYMNPDAYNKNNQFYNIANIYYDTIDDELIRKSNEKPLYKEKLRLRSYGVPNLDDKVFLEIKKKYKGIVNKRRTNIILKDAYDYIETGSINRKPMMNNQVCNEIDYMLKKYKLIPKVYLTYDRMAFFCKEDDDFRLTFDTNIRTRRENVGLECGNYGELLLKPEQWVMEMKASKGIPLWFTKLLSENKLYPESISKYGTEYKKYVIKNNFKKGENLCLNQLCNQQQAVLKSVVQF